jgi:hypothetical protein
LRLVPRPVAYVDVLVLGNRKWLSRTQDRARRSCSLGYANLLELLLANSAGSGICVDKQGRETAQIDSTWMLISQDCDMSTRRAGTPSDRKHYNWCKFIQKRPDTSQNSLHSSPGSPDRLGLSACRCCLLSTHSVDRTPGSSALSRIYPTLLAKSDPPERADTCKYAAGRLSCRAPNRSAVCLLLDREMTGVKVLPGMHPLGNKFLRAFGG